MRLSANFYFPSKTFAVIIFIKHEEVFFDFAIVVTLILYSYSLILLCEYNDLWDRYN